MYSLFKKLLFTLEPETAHDFVKKMGRFLPHRPLFGLSQKGKVALRSKMGNRDFPNPIGLAAGFDKNGEMLDLANFLGFGFAEIGSVTALPCEGYPKPRIFRLPQDESLVNRMGLPNWGADAIARHLSTKKSSLPLGISIASTPFFVRPSRGEIRKTGIEDILYSLNKLRKLGAYFVLNLSCPNTPNGKTFEEPGDFIDLAAAVFSMKKEMELAGRPILVKLSPNLERGILVKLVEASLKHGFDGFVVSNTGSSRSGLKTPKERLEKIGEGGVSGRALAEAANRQLKMVSEITENEKILIGVGGLMSFGDLLTKLSLGASHFEVYTGLVYKGPFFIHELCKKLAAFCRRKGVENYAELRGQKGLVEKFDFL